MSGPLNHRQRNPAADFLNIAGPLWRWLCVLKKGAHIAIEGELRSREYDREVTVGAEKKTITQRVWEIRVDTILKLDRPTRMPWGVAVLKPS